MRHPHDDARRPATSSTKQDEATANSRPMGGVENAETPDRNSTTGTTQNEEFVGRAAGQDVGYAGETGAERRAAADDDG